MLSLWARLTFRSLAFGALWDLGPLGFWALYHLGVLAFGGPLGFRAVGVLGLGVGPGRLRVLREFGGLQIHRRVVLEGSGGLVISRV